MGYRSFSKEGHDLRPRFPHPEVVVVTFLIEEEDIRRDVSLLEAIIFPLIKPMDRG